MRIRRYLTLAAAAVLIVPPAWADLYVDAENGFDSQLCGDAGAPCKTINGALDQAFIQGVPNEVIRVLPGVYRECIITIEALPVRIVGESRTSTIIDGSECVFGEPVVDLGDGSVLEGFTVREGTGSGIVAFGKATITNNIVAGNEGLLGGGIYTFGSVTITNNEITDNVAVAEPGVVLSGFGGGLYVYSTVYPGQDEDVRVELNNVERNIAAIDGGGAVFYAFGDTGPAPRIVVRDNSFRDNTAERFGGGLLAFSYAESGASTSIQITNNIIEGNSLIPSAAGGYGGGAWVGTYGIGDETVEILDNRFGSNTATFSGGGLRVAMAPPESLAETPVHTVDVRYNTFDNNVSEFDGGAMDAYLLAPTLEPGSKLSLFIRDNLVTDNVADGSSGSSACPESACGFGGGVFALLSSERTKTPEVDFRIERNRITRNRGEHGAGIYVGISADADPEANSLRRGDAGAFVGLRNNLVADNRALSPAPDVRFPAIGAGVYVFLGARGRNARAETSIDLHTVAGNASDGGGAVHLESWTLRDTGGDGGSARATVRNSVIFENDAAGVFAGTTDDSSNTDNLEFDVTYTSFFGNSGELEGQPPESGGTGNLFVAPLLNTAYVPDRCSPVIDAGDPGSDFSEEPYPNGGRINMGHLGGTALDLDGSDNTVRSLADITGDGVVDGIDVLRLAASFGASGGETRYLAAADLDQEPGVSENYIEGQDLALVAADFGIECP